MNEQVTAWMDKYVKAWTSNEPEDIRDLFTDDAVYSTRPNDPAPWRGLDEIVDSWIGAGDKPEDWTFEGALLAGDGALAFVQAVTTYLNGEPTYDNLWVIRLTPDGRASSFTEWFMARKE